MKHSQIRNSFCMLLAAGACFSVRAADYTWVGDGNMSVLFTQPDPPFSGTWKFLGGEIVGREYWGEGNLISSLAENGYVLLQYQHLEAEHSAGLSGRAA